MGAQSDITVLETIGYYLLNLIASLLCDTSTYPIETLANVL